ncbi:MAG: type IV toxin-antitoxin system AbiEi family antitoxin [Jatrophihabitantaceae bacterium]
MRYGATVPLAAASADADGRPVFVHATFLAAKSRDALRRAGVQYLDVAGNAWIEFGDVFIEVRGRPRPDGAAPHRRAAGNLFSAGRAQVVFALLAWPYLWRASQREISAAAGVSVGQVNDTLKLLRDAKHGVSGTRPDAADLLDLWAAAFPAGLAHRLTLATYRGEIGRATVDAGGPVFISGEAAATDLLRSTSLTIYVADLDPRLPVVNRWRSDGEPNIIVRRKFWNTPGVADNAHTDAEAAPWPLVYADLLASDDPRVRSAAKQWRDRHARPEQHA